MLRKSVLLMLAFLVVGAADAQATLRIQNHNVPAGDPTPITYRLNSPGWTEPIDFVLKDGEDRSFGPNAGTYTVQALLPAGWAVEAILCESSRTSHPETDGVVVTDVSAGLATFSHGPDQHQTCSFTNGKVRPSGGSPPSSGISPSPPASEIPPKQLPRHPAIVGVRAGRGYAEASIRLTQRSIIKGRLLKRKTVIVGSKRIEREPGTRVLRVKLQRKRMRRMRQRGLEQVTLTLRVAVTAPNGATHVFKHRVLVDL
jgi:hypothetical protein